MSRLASSIVRGFVTPRRKSAESGPTAGERYVLRARRKVKVWTGRQTPDGSPPDVNGDGA